MYNSTLNLEHLRVKDIYRFLIEEETMTGEEEDGGIPRSLLPLRVGLVSPTTDWPKTCRLSRQRGLGPHLTSFLFQLLHQILPTGERVARILPASSPLCTRCGDEDSTVNETLIHDLFHCSANFSVTDTLLAALRVFIPAISPIKILTLDYDVTESLEFPLTWITVSFLSSLWSMRTDKKKVCLFKIRSDLEANCRILQETKFQNQNILTSQVVDSMF
jgi:hypothetical protein